MKCRMPVYRMPVLVMIFLVITVYATGFKTWGLEINGTDLVNPQNAVICRDGGIWRTNYSRGTASFPLTEAWNPVQVGKTTDQPVLMDDYIFVQAEKKISAINKTTGRLLGSFALENSSRDSGLLLIKKDAGTYRLLTVDNSGIRCIVAGMDRNSADFKQEWSYKTTGGAILADSATVLEDGNKTLNRQYVGACTNDGRLIMLFLDSGKETVNGNMTTGSAFYGSCLIPYFDSKNLLSRVAIPASTGSGTGYVQGSTVLNGVQQEDVCLNRNMSSGSKMKTLKGPSALTYISDTLKGGIKAVLIVQELKGVIVGFDLENNKLLFRINRYAGTEIKSFTVKGSYIMAAYEKDTSNKSILMAFDITKAVNVAQDHDDNGDTANEAIIFTDFPDETAAGAAAFSVMDAQPDNFGGTRYTTYREVFVTGSACTDTSKNNLAMYYMDKYDAALKKPIPVPYAFLRDGKTYSGLHITGGVTSRLSMAGGYLVFVDGKGYLHGFTAKTANNISLVNMDNSSNVLDRSSGYTAAVDVVNYTGMYVENIPVKFLLSDDRGNIVHTHSSNIDFGPDGCTVYLKYTVPKDFDSKKLGIKAELNTEREKQLNEDTYDDNIADMTLDVKDDLDLVLASIDNRPLPANKRITVIVAVENKSYTSLDKPKVPVTFAINWNGQTVSKTKEVIVNSKKTGNTHVAFAFTTPDENTSLTVSAKVNDTKAYLEKDMSNNSRTITVRVLKNTGNPDGEGKEKVGWSNRK